MFGQKWLYWGKVVASVKVVTIWHVVVFGQSGCNRAKVVVFGQSGCMRTKVVVFR